VAEGGALLRRYTGKTRIEGSNPSHSASSPFKAVQTQGFGMRRVLLIIMLPEAMNSSDSGWNSQGPRFQAPP
jgi:hypothetical protein